MLNAEWLRTYDTLRVIDSVECRAFARNEAIQTR